MGYIIPDVSYSIKVTNLKFNTVEDLAINSECRVSYNCKITITLIPNNCGLSQFDIRATVLESPWDIDQGKLLSRSTNLRQSSAHTCEFIINTENFPEAGSYRIGLYAKNELDGSWDVSYLVFTLNGTQLILKDGTALSVLTTREIPNE